MLEEEEHETQYELLNKTDIWMCDLVVHHFQVYRDCIFILIWVDFTMQYQTHIISYARGACCIWSQASFAFFFPAQYYMW